MKDPHAGDGAGAGNSRPMIGCLSRFHSSRASGGRSRWPTPPEQGPGYEVPTPGRPPLSLSNRRRSLGRASSLLGPEVAPGSSSLSAPELASSSHHAQSALRSVDPAVPVFQQTRLPSLVSLESIYRVTGTVVPRYCAALLGPSTTQGPRWVWDVTASYRHSNSGARSSLSSPVPRSRGLGGVPHYGLSHAPGSL